MATDAQIKTIARHFVIAAIWADCPEGTHPRATKEATAAAEGIARKFTDDNAALFELAMKCDGYGSHPDAGSPEAAFGHDLYLTLKGHGVGFWDREELNVYANDVTQQSIGDALSEACDNSDDEGLHSVQFYRGWLYI